MLVYRGHLKKKGIKIPGVDQSSEEEPEESSEISILDFKPNFCQNDTLAPFDIVKQEELATV